ncbi:hypothetical protein AALO_G00158890 [Alosa alosa]|uniref:Anoctamin n=1 Tax=Alosa alosa TaxID=278164 RepID=A0AAV6GGZ7_9TELE|nr:hypothetical protein AALO_G00158890 [Alosa alosa]
MALNRSPSGTETWNGAPERLRNKLQSVARDLSQFSLDTANGMHESSAGEEQLASEQAPGSPGSRKGVFFSDGVRRVDYVLVYHCKKRMSQNRLSIISNGSIPQPAANQRRRSIEPELGEAGLEVEFSKEPNESEKALIRQEFEAGLQGAGLQIERDKEPRTVRFTRVHVPWAVLSREAERLKIRVPTKKTYKLREKTGLSGMMDTMWERLREPFQPGVTNTEEANNRVVKMPFNRDKLHLFDITSKDDLFDSATRGRIVCEILRRTACTRTCQTMGINTLLAREVYDSAFPLHDGDFDTPDKKDERNDRQMLHEEWANYGVCFKYQPVDLIRRYFGEQIGLYFAWLGVYTQLLIPPSVLGVIVFIYGFLTVDANVPSQEMCNAGLNFTMCPMCDRVCDYWPLNIECSAARASYLFDNTATVVFAIFMSLWAAVFLEHWKRKQRCLQHQWDLTEIDDEEEDLRPEYEDTLMDKIQKKNKKKKKEPDPVTDEGGKLLTSKPGENPMFLESLTWRDRWTGYCMNVSSILLMIGVTFSAVTGVILYRVCVFAVMSMNPDPEAKANVRVTVTTTAVVINLLIVLVLDEIYGAIATWITELEIPKTEAAFEEHLILKAFLLKSMNAFAPVFYVAFFKGRFAGRPGDYVYVFKDFRMEECAPSGCLIEVCIQLGIIMLGKQLIQNNVFEIAIPKLKKMYREYEEKKAGELLEEGEDPNREPQPWENDYSLEPYEGLSPEYMEMIIQYGFVTLFVASFPLAPVFALLNNVIEIRLDAAKFITEVRRPDAVRAKEIGIWHNILSGISKFAVITNAFVISFTSEFIPRMVYQYIYSETGTMHGYTDYTLAYFNTSNFKPGTAPNATQYDKDLKICRYKDYRDPPWSHESYQLSKQYWSVLAARLAFVIFFQNLAMFLSMLVAWLISFAQGQAKDQIKRERAALMELLLSQEPSQSSSRRTARSHDAPVIIQGPEEDPPGGGGGSRRDSPSPEEPSAHPDTVSMETDLREEGEAQETSRQPSKPKLVAQRSLDASSSISKEGSETLMEGEQNPRTKARCRTLPPRYRGPRPGDSSAQSSHSSVFTHLSQQVPPSRSQLMRLKDPVKQSSQSELARSILRNRSRPPSVDEAAETAPKPPPRPPSDMELAQRGLSRPASQSHSSIPPRDLHRGPRQTST